MALNAVRLRACLGAIGAVYDIRQFDLFQRASRSSGHRERGRMVVASASAAVVGRVLEWISETLARFLSVGNRPVELVLRNGSHVSTCSAEKAEPRKEPQSQVAIRSWLHLSVVGVSASQRRSSDGGREAPIGCLRAPRRVTLPLDQVRV